MKTLFIFLSICLFTNFGFTASLFKTSFHEVKFTSNNILDDKKKNIYQIKYQSIDEIFKNVLMKNDYDKIKIELDEDFINYFILSILVENEKIVNNNYYSNIKVNFDKKKIVEYLRNRKIPYTEFLPEKYLTIIYENHVLNKNLFTSKNSLYNFLLNNNKIYDFFQIPNLDVNDRYLIDILDIETKNIKKIDTFSNKYKNDNIVIITSKEINDYYQFTNYIFVNNNLEEINSYTLKDKKYDEFFLNLKLDIIDRWKLYNNISNTSENIIKCTINYFNLLELKEIKLRIKDVSSIKELELETIALNTNKYIMNYYGNKDHLSKLFDINGIKIKIKNNFCNIYLR